MKACEAFTKHIATIVSVVTDLSGRDVEKAVETRGQKNNREISAVPGADYVCNSVITRAQGNGFR
jgi:hypothetical protein